MCTKLSEGGQRCASHTRGPAMKAYNELMDNGKIAENAMNDLIDYASTPSGQKDMQSILDRLPENMVTEIAIIAFAQKKGEENIEAYHEFNRRKKAASVPTRSDILATAEQAGISFDETHDGVQIGDYTVEAHTDGARIYQYVNRDPSVDPVHLDTFTDVEAAITEAASMDGQRAFSTPSLSGKFDDQEKQAIVFTLARTQWAAVKMGETLPATETERATLNKVWDSYQRYEQSKNAAQTQLDPVYPPADTMLKELDPATVESAFQLVAKFRENNAPFMGKDSYFAQAVLDKRDETPDVD